MYMAYENNPRLPRLRMEAVRMVKSGRSIRSVARHFQYSHQAILNWLEKTKSHNYKMLIPTLSSRPLHHPHALPKEIDTIHDGAIGEQIYIYTGLDVCSRFAHAIPAERINTHQSLRFVEKTRKAVPFSIATLQSDHGSEFSKHFTKMIVAHGMAHRHSRVRKPNDNAHLERFNRTIQQECIYRIPRSIKVWKKEIPLYLHYY